MVLVGSRLKPFHGGNIIMGRKSSIGSLIENQRNTRDVRCGEHNITSDIELIDMQDINKAYDRVTSNDVKYRFVIDMKSLK
jgi:uncharacterized zinc-type alcohol dehydrogenase-like protein